MISSMGSWAPSSSNKLLVDGATLGGEADLALTLSAEAAEDEAGCDGSGGGGGGGGKTDGFAAADTVAETVAVICGELV